MKFSHLGRQFGQKVFGISPVLNPVRPTHVLWSNPLQKVGDMITRRTKMFDPHYAFQNFLRFRIPRGGGYDPRTIDEVNSPHQSDVLPDFGLPRNGRRFAHGLLLERVDDGRFSHVGVADEADGDLLLVREEGRELSEELD